MIDQQLDASGHGYTVLHLWGSHYDMGYQYGYLLGDSVTAIVIGVLLMKNVTPGPEVFSEQASLVYGIYLVGLAEAQVLDNVIETGDGTLGRDVPAQTRRGADGNDGGDAGGGPGGAGRTEARPRCGLGQAVALGHEPADGYPASRRPNPDAAAEHARASG